MAFSSFLICIARDPGPVNATINDPTEGAENDAEMEMSEALMAPEFDVFAPGKWCRKCWVCPRTKFDFHVLKWLNRRQNLTEHIIALIADDAC